MLEYEDIPNIVKNNLAREILSTIQFADTDFPYGFAISYYLDDIKDDMIFDSAYTTFTLPTGEVIDIDEIIDVDTLALVALDKLSNNYNVYRIKPAGVNINDFLILDKKLKVEDYFSYLEGNLLIDPKSLNLSDYRKINRGDIF